MAETTDGSETDEMSIFNHSPIHVIDESGERNTVRPCKLMPEDINDDGTVSLPPSGECDCSEKYSGVDVPLRREVS